MLLTDAHADQIAALLNERNELTRIYSRVEVLSYRDNYLCHFDEAHNVIACIEISKVQWYQAEIKHLTVSAEHARRGHARTLLREAEQLAQTLNARLLQCTIREDNVPSRTLFENARFWRSARFFNNRSGMNVDVYQKVLSPPTLPP
jgi:ribosomal protein S18 acetylase RimI-like enzyme